LSFLEDVERVIEDVRWARNEPGAPEHRVYHGLRAIAAELRARQPAAPGEALRALEARIEHVRRSKTRLGYDGRKLVALAEELVGRWPTVRLALEGLGTELKEKT
jgi:hypothetical protein